MLHKAHFFFYHYVVEKAQLLSSPNYLCNINRLVRTMQTECVYFVVRKKYFRLIRVTFSL
jgi:hypothetical protein